MQDKIEWINGNRREGLNWNSLELVKNRDKNKKPLLNAGWVYVKLGKVFGNRKLIYSLFEKGWNFSGVDYLWLPSLPRAGDYIKLPIINVLYLEKYGINSHYEDNVLAKVEMVIINALSCNVNLDKAEKSIANCNYEIEVTVVNIYNILELDTEIG